MDTPANQEAKPASPMAQKMAELQALVEARQAEFRTKLQALCDEYGMVPVVRQDVVFVPRQQG